MLKGAVAKRYAQALFEIGKEKGLLERFLEDLRVIVQILQDPGLSQALVNPKIPLSAKREMVHRLLASLSPDILHFVDLLIVKGRTSVVGQISQTYQHLLHEHQGIQVAQVTTAVDLDDQERKMLADRLSQITGKKILLETRVDPAIIGGLVARIGDRVIDGSTLSKLKALKAEMAGAT